MADVVNNVQAEGLEVEVIHNPGTILLGIIFTVVIFQVSLLKWKKSHRQSFMIFSLSALWLLPFLMAILKLDLLFIAVWIIYSLISISSLREAWLPRIDPKTPRHIYRLFRTLFDLTMGMAGVGYFIFLISAFVFPSQYIFAIGFTLLFYGLYFGVLSRDIVDYIVEKMSVTIGYYSIDGLPKKNLPSNLCAICGDEVCSLNQFNHDTVNSSLLKASSDELPFVVLNCNHTVHTMCLHGWCLIGKKDMCPYCKEKVDLLLISTNPWRDPEFVYGKFLDFVRYMIVWLPCLLFIMHYVIIYLKN